MRIAVRTDRVRPLIIRKQKDNIGALRSFGGIRVRNTGGQQHGGYQICWIHDDRSFTDFSREPTLATRLATTSDFAGDSTQDVRPSYGIPATVDRVHVSSVAVQQKTLKYITCTLNLRAS